MLYEVWGSNPYFSSDNFVKTLTLLNWGKWGKSYVSNYGSSPTLNFEIKVMNLRFDTRFDFRKSSNSPIITCLLSTYSSSQDICFSKITLPDIIPKHQIRQCLFPFFEDQYHQILKFIVRFLKLNPWVLVNKTNSYCMTPKMWHIVGDLFAAFELERNDNKSLENLEDKFSRENIMQNS
jgi:hypothetical protein